jgi:26S proteasome regulatory subunit T4
VRFSLKDLEADYAKTEEDIKAVQSVGQIIGEVMKQLDDERCQSHRLSSFIATLK